MSANTLVRPQPAVALGRAVWELGRWLCLVLFVVGAVIMLSLGTRETPFENLRNGLEAGTVQQVRIEGAMGGTDGLVHEERGYATVRLVWQDGPFRKVAEVRQAATSADIPQATEQDDLPLVVGRVDSFLRESAPGVRTTWGDPPGSWAAMYGWQLYGGWAALIFLPMLLPLLVIAYGPDPRGATAWAWFWLCLGPQAIVGIPAYLLWGAKGAVPGRRRLTGGWAFVLCLVLFNTQVL